MLTKLTKGLTKEEEDKFSSSFSSSSFFREHLTKILNEDINTLQNSMLKEDFLSQETWEIKVVETLAKIHSLKKMLSYLK